MGTYYNERPPFTLLVCRGALKEPFRLIDIGVQGGVNIRWKAFGDYLDVWGFDALPDAIEALQSNNPRHRYLNIGIGNEDGERLFERTANAFGSAFLPMIAKIEDIGRTPDGRVPSNWTLTQIRRLDTLFASHTIGPTDFMKMDCEGFEIHILKGAQKFLRESGIFGIESETHFFANPQFPRSHFVEVYEQIALLGFEVYDGTSHPLPAGSQPNTFDFTFLNLKQPTTPDRLIKMIATCEIYGFSLVARELIERHSEVLSTRMDIEEALRCFPIAETPRAPEPPPSPGASAPTKKGMLRAILDRL